MKLSVLCSTIRKRKPILEFTITFIFCIIIGWIEGWSILLFVAPYSFLISYLFAYKQEVAWKFIYIIGLLSFIFFAVFFSKSYAWIIDPQFIITIGLWWFAIFAIPLFLKKERGKLIEQTVIKALNEYFGNNTTTQPPSPTPHKKKCIENDCRGSKGEF